MQVLPRADIYVEGHNIIFYDTIFSFKHVFLLFHKTEFQRSTNKYENSSSHMLGSTRYNGKSDHIIYHAPHPQYLFCFRKMRRKWQKPSSLLILLQTLYYSLVIQLLLCAKRWTANHDLKTPRFLYFPTLTAV